MITDNILHYLIRNFIAQMLALNISIIYPLQIQGTSNMCLLYEKKIWIINWVRFLHHDAMKWMTLIFASHFKHMKMHPESILGYGLWIINLENPSYIITMTIISEFNSLSFETITSPVSHNVLSSLVLVMAWYQTQYWAINTSCNYPDNE